MDALAYLIQRKSPPARKCALVLLAAAVLGWINLKLCLLVPVWFPTLHQHGLLNLLWGSLLMMTSAVAVGAYVGATVLAPLFAFGRSAQTLQSWVRQRALEEMLCAGMSGRQVADGLVRHSLRWWAVVAAPVSLAALPLYPDVLSGVGFRDAAWAVLFGLLGWLSLGYLALTVASWGSFRGGHIKTPLLGALALLAAGPALALMAPVGGKIVALLAFLYVIAVGRGLLIHALENWDRLAAFDLRMRRMMRFKGWGGGPISENPIVAREAFRGTNAGELIFRGLTFGGFVFCSLVASLSHAPWIFLFLLFPVVLTSSYRAASRMSQVVTEEVESSTLETIRSTPISSEIFLNGWLRAVVGRQWRDLSALLLGVVAVTALNGNASMLYNGMVPLGFFLCAVLPLCGAYLGASIAGQAKKRAQISGQLMASCVAMTVVGAPQVVVSAQLVYPPVTLVALAILTGGVCWLLDSGARKSLNRTFLPQK